MKKKTLVQIIIIATLILSGFGAAATHQKLDVKADKQTQTISFSEPTFSEKDGSVQISMQNTNSYYNEPGQPMLPAVIKTFEYPFGTTIASVQVIFSPEKELQITQPIILGSTPQTLLQENKQQNIQTAMILKEQYPNNRYQTSINVGLDGTTHVIYLTIQAYPVHYKPFDNKISYSDQATITIKTQQPTTPLLTADTYDLVIITPEKFSSLLQPLVDHKNTVGVQTLLKTTESIYTDFTGRDKPEQIKYFIKDALEQYGIKYVLLVGGINSFIKAVPRDDANQGTLDWNFPVRYTNLYDGGTTQDPGYISDLYFADIYKYENATAVFDDWDSNGNNIFAEWKAAGSRDIIDLYPDVYVGRLACVNNFEVKTMVKKIIAYESSKADPAWFNNMVLIGGDTFNDSGSTNYFEGEVETQKELSYMTNFTGIELYASNRDNGGLVPEPRDIIKTVSKGCGFLAFAGHGSPERWNTYWPGAFNEARAKGFWWWDVPFVHNGDKLPVCVIGGCHNSDFNITATSFINKNMWTYGPDPECISWLLARKPSGGTIATMGNTGLGYGTVGNNGDLDGDGVDDPDCVEALGGYLEGRFFKAYGSDGIQVLGDCWGQAITMYLNIFPGMDDKLDCKSVEQWVLLGDPSLMIGGYSS
jgi:hypothetical protein